MTLDDYSIFLRKLSTRKSPAALPHKTRRIVGAYGPQTAPAFRKLPSARLSIDLLPAPTRGADDAGIVAERRRLERDPLDFRNVRVRPRGRLERPPIDSTRLRYAATNDDNLRRNQRDRARGRQPKVMPGPFQHLDRVPVALGRRLHHDFRRHLV